MGEWREGENVPGAGFGDADTLAVEVLAQPLVVLCEAAELELTVEERGGVVSGWASRVGTRQLVGLGEQRTTWRASCWSSSRQGGDVWW